MKPSYCRKRWSRADERDGFIFVLNAIGAGLFIKKDFGMVSLKETSAYG
ncbi:MAG: hypothetical protein ICV53_12045 [Flavisolibacter sp.]|nr:hypothetical protein [Flavisolibacter sp.]MBD0366820.1 hypothetical protein [Flavisolibacter sp.]